METKYKFIENLEDVGRIFQEEGTQIYHLLFFKDKQLKKEHALELQTGNDRFALIPNVYRFQFTSIEYEGERLECYALNVNLQNHTMNYEDYIFNVFDDPLEYYLKLVEDVKLENRRAYPVIVSDIFGTGKTVLVWKDDFSVSIQSERSGKGYWRVEARKFEEHCNGYRYYKVTKENKKIGYPSDSDYIKIDLKENRDVVLDIENFEDGKI